MKSSSEEPVGAHPLRHVAIIMDGNNRWAALRDLPGSAGHEIGVKRVRDVLDACQKHKIEVITLFAFSSENWKRPDFEVRTLMALLTSYLKKEVRQLVDRGIKLRFIGRRDNFSTRLSNLIAESEALTSAGNQTLVLAVDYGGRWEITEAARKLASLVQQGRLKPEDITEQLMHSQMSLTDLPPPDLCIRTAGEQRISNFMLWHMAYTEFYFADCYWPDFDGLAFGMAIDEYHRRQRRFGKREAGPEGGRRHA